MDIPADAAARAADDPLDLMDVEASFGADEVAWRDRTRRFVLDRIAPTIDEDFENGHFRRELVAELGDLGVLGMHLEGYGCAGAGAVSYGLVCRELEAG